MERDESEGRSVFCHDELIGRYQDLWDGIYHVDLEWIGGCKLEKERHGLLQGLFCTRQREPWW